jgi:hypothetical protein
MFLLPNLTQGTYFLTDVSEILEEFWSGEWLTSRVFLQIKLVSTCLNFRGDVFGPWKLMREQRKDIFYETTGLLMEDDEKWHDIRSKVQQDLMRPKSAHYYMDEIDNISEEFMNFIRKTRSTDEKIITNSLPELYRFTFESICYIALDTRLGCMKVPLDPEISKMFEASKAFLGK